MFQLAYYNGGKRVQQNFADKAQAKRVARQVLSGLTDDAELVDAVATPEIESLAAAKKVLASGYALHVARGRALAGGLQTRQERPARSGGILPASSSYRRTPVATEGSFRTLRQVAGIIRPLPVLRLPLP